MKRTVKDLMKQMDLSHFPSVTPEASIGQVVSLLWKMKAGAALILEAGIVKGIYSERDFLKIAVERKAMPDLSLPIEPFMTKQVIFVTPDYNLEECLVVMSEAAIRHLPVNEGQKPIALLSQSHIAEALVQDKEHMINELTKFITGSQAPESPRSGKVPIRTLGEPLEKRPAIEL